MCVRSEALRLISFSIVTLPHSSGILAQCPKKPNKSDIRQGTKESGKSTMTFPPVLPNHVYGCVQDHSPLPLLMLLCECSSALVQCWAPASTAQLLGMWLCHRGYGCCWPVGAEQAEPPCLASSCATLSSLADRLGLWKWVVVPCMDVCPSCKTTPLV